MFYHNRCEFCDEFCGGSHNSFAARYGSQLRDRTVFETDRLKVLPTLGHFVRGYLLLVPKVHYCALADVPSEMIQELEQVKRSLVRQLCPVYGSYVFFEHGARTPEAGGCGISHAHLHAVPLRLDEVLTTLKQQFSYNPLGSLSDLRNTPPNTSYLYYEDSSVRSWVFYPTFLPSQYMRRLLAKAAGVSDWDWRRSGREAAFVATTAEVSAILSACA